MRKTILITGATDGIGKAAAEALAEQGHRLLLHGRKRDRLDTLARELAELSNRPDHETYRADLSRLTEVLEMCSSVKSKHERLDVLVNNAGVLKTPVNSKEGDPDVRFLVNAIAPFLLTRQLVSLMDRTGRVINLSSAAQASVDEEALAGKRKGFGDLAVYSQSKLALNMWTRQLASQRKGETPIFVALNPGSLLATKMVKEGFGMEGRDPGKGSDVIVKACLSDEFNEANGLYYDNDAGRFASPHRDALDDRQGAKITSIIENFLTKTLPSS